MSKNQNNDYIVEAIDKYVDTTLILKVLGFGVLGGFSIFGIYQGIVIENPDLIWITIMVLVMVGAIVTMIKYQKVTTIIFESLFTAMFKWGLVALIVLSVIGIIWYLVGAIAGMSTTTLLLLIIIFQLNSQRH